MEIFILTKKGIGKRIEVDGFRPMGRGARGITAIALDADDEVAAVVALKKDEKQV